MFERNKHHKQPPGPEPQTQRSDGSKRLCCAIIFGALIIGVGLAIGLALGLRADDDDGNGADEQVPTPTTTVTPVAAESSKFGVYHTAAVASDGALCSKVGSDIIILKGGSAIDAAIAALLCNGLVNSHSMGIGGGFVMTMYNSTSKTSEVLMAREKAPLAAAADMFAPEKGISSTTGGKAIAVPGELAGYWEAHQRFGRVAWKDLFEPSIKIAREGIPIGKGLAGAIDDFKDKFDIYPELKAWFYDDATGKVKKEGDTFTRPKIADTYQALANGNKDTYYDGSLTDDIIADITDEGGIITKEDLKKYQAEWKAPVTAVFNGMSVYSVPPPASGVVMEYILNILDGYNFKPEDVSTNEKTVLTYHRVIEAMKFAYAKRTNLGDADFVNVTELVTNMTSMEFGASIREQIDDQKTHDTMFYGPTFYDSELTGTSHLSVLDRDGNAVAITSTVNTKFGSKVIGNRTGIIFNSEMDDFSTPNVTNFYGVKASPANFIEPEKRPLSSMSPTVIVDASGKVKLVVGASGGTKITTSSALMALHTLSFGKEVNEAIDASRIHHQLLPKEVKVENTLSQDYIEGLKKKGHVIIEENPGSSVVQAILTKNNEIRASSDWRKGGAPYGY